MKPIIGLSISRDAVRVLVLRRGSIIWAGQRGRDSASTVAAAIEDALVEVRRARIRRAALRVAVGPSMSQLKQIGGLPRNTGPDRLVQVIRQMAARYFIDDGARLEVCNVCPISDGLVWASAIEAPVLAAVESIARTHRLRLESVFPAGAVLHVALSDPVIHWEDGRVRIEVERSEMVVNAVRRRLAAIPAESLEHAPVPALATLGDKAFDFADAYGAAAMDRSSPWFSLGVPEGGASKDTPLGRIRVPVSLTAAALAFAAMSPAAAVIVRRSTERELSLLRGSEMWQAANRAEMQLARANEALVVISAFRNSRVTVSTALAEISRILPDHAVLLHIDVSGTVVRMSVSTHDTASVVNALRASNRFENVKYSEPNARSGPSQNGPNADIRLDIVAGGNTQPGAARATD